jgi:hypothetical protein
MFEQLAPDPGEKGLEKAARVFYIVAVLNLLAIPLAFVAYRGQGALPAVAAVVGIVFAGLAFVTARGIENQRRWAKWLGIALAVLSLPRIPIGTIIGIATLVYINRASKAGLFRV